MYSRKMCVNQLKTEVGVWLQGNLKTTAAGTILSSVDKYIHLKSDLLLY